MMAAAPEASGRRPWPPCSGRGEHLAVIVVMILAVCAVMSGVALNVGIRCFRQRRQTNAKSRGGRDEAVDLEGIVPAAEVMQSKSRPECAICLSEMEEGERVRVMGLCRHAFHDLCISRWLFFSNSSVNNHLSCPTCRRPCLPASNLV